LLKPDETIKNRVTTFQTTRNSLFSPDFSSRGKQRLPGIECLPIWSTVVVLYEWKTGWGQI